MNYICPYELLEKFTRAEVLGVLAISGGTENSKISLTCLHLCSEDERKSYGFGTMGE